jgi:hypothetical protein
MKNFYVLNTFLSLSISFALIDCTSSSKTQEVENIPNITTNDSTQILQIIKDMYAWEETKSTLGDFTLAYPEKGSCTGIDKEANKNRLAELRKTGFFTEEFFKNYDRILQKMDGEIKKDTTKYYEGDGLELNYIDGSPWCNCQDNPDKFWETLKLKDLLINGDNASTKWTWIWKDEFNYNVKLKKINNTWKISNLEGFDSL